VIIGGLVSSTLLARVVTPVLYRMWPPALRD
jgi:multidrug efflux pump subunit AcrB